MNILKIINQYFKKPLNSTADLKQGEGAVMVEGDHKIAVYKKENGEVVKYSSKCTHLGCEIGWDNAQKIWVCPCHGAEFNVDGSVRKGPAKESLKQI
jgi:Rieske Fe-S protein